MRLSQAPRRSTNLRRAYVAHNRALRKAKRARRAEGMSANTLRRAARTDPAVMAAAKRIKDLGG